jgi:hypothetical protein
MFETIIHDNRLLINESEIIYDEHTKNTNQIKKSTEYLLPSVASSSKTHQYYVTFYHCMDDSYVMIVIDPQNQCTCIKEQNDVVRQLSGSGKKDLHFLYKVCFLTYNYFFEERFALSVSEDKSDIAYQKMYHQIDSCLKHNKSYKVNHATFAHYQYLMVLDIVRENDQLKKISLRDLVSNENN